MVEGEGGLQGDALDTGAPARLTPCPAGGAPQEGEGQPQQHGFWLEIQGLLGRRGQAIQPQKGASPDLVGPSMVGAGLTWPAESCGPVLVLGVWCLGTLLWALYTLLGRVAPRQEERSRCQWDRKELGRALPGGIRRAIWGRGRALYCLGLVVTTNNT